MFPTIVSLGEDTTGTPAGTGAVYSREKAILAPIAPLQAIEGMGNVTITGLSTIALGSLASTVNGDISALGKLTTPVLTVGTDLLSSSIFPTFSASEFCTNGTLGTCPSTLRISTANYNTVSTAPCSAGTPSTTCVVQRSPVTISASKPSCANSSGVAETCTNALFGCSSCYSSTGSTSDTFTLTSGTATFQPGDYVFCSFNVTGGTVSTTTATAGPVRIFIDKPTSTRCSGDTSVGNFTDTPGIDNLLEPSSPLGTTTAPSDVQIYVVGNGTANGTTVQIGPTTESTSLSAVYGEIVYAPMSSVTVNVPALCVLVCAGGIFDGSIIGDNVNVSALTVTEDLDVGNFPLYAGINAFRAVQYIQCSASGSSGVPVTSLSGNETTDTSGC